MDHISRLIGIYISSFFIAQACLAQDSLTISRDQAEKMFLEENVLLLAAELRIPQAEAMTLQAKLWPNPTFEIDEVNIGTTVNGINGTAHLGETLPPIAGNFGKDQQLSASLEQLVQTAGKRKKLVALGQINESMAKEYFKDLLRGLKLEFRNSLSELQYLQLSKGLYNSQLTSIRQLSEAYQNQVILGNVSKGEYIRLKAAELEIAKKVNDIDDEIHQKQKDLKLLMNIPSPTYLNITDEGYVVDISKLGALQLGEVNTAAFEMRADYKLSILEEDYSKDNYAYEKAQRVPDLTFKAGYDRGGNFLYNFFGLGISMDLPILNRNQGNIEHAKLEMESAKLLHQFKAKEVENEVILAWQNLKNSIALAKQIDEDYEETLDELLLSYIQNFKNRDIGMLAFLDFLEAYLENKDIILEAALEIQKKSEELNYVVGSDLIK